MKTKTSYAVEIKVIGENWARSNHLPTVSAAKRLQESFRKEFPSFRTRITEVVEVPLRRRSKK